MNGHFIISLDFELAWGVLDHFSETGYGNNIMAVHHVLPQILKLFAKYDIHATIAYVGFLNCNSVEQLRQCRPEHTPNYENRKLSPYNDDFSYIIGHEQYYFAPELIRQIRQTPGIELASHTFSHYYCMEKGQDNLSFEDDMKMVVMGMKNETGNVETIIFPRNQVNDKYLSILQKYGIRSYRGNPKRLFKPNGGMIQRILRLADTYINLTGHNTYPAVKPNSTLVDIPASRFFKPYSNKLFFLEALKIHRIKKSMSHAARKGEMFHLWWHPHNFGCNTRENLENLENILQHYQYLHMKYNFNSVSMKEYRDKLDNLSEN